MKNEKRTVFLVPFFYENEKRTREVKIQSKNLLNMTILVNCLKFVCHIDVKTKSKYKKSVHNPCMESIIQKINFLKNENCIFSFFNF